MSDAGPSLTGPSADTADAGPTVKATVTITTMAATAIIVPAITLHHKITPINHLTIGVGRVGVAGEAESAG